MPHGLFVDKGRFELGKVDSSGASALASAYSKIIEFGRAREEDSKSEPKLDASQSMSASTGCVIGSENRPSNE